MDDKFRKLLELAAEALAEEMGEEILNEDIPHHEFSEEHNRKIKAAFDGARQKLDEQNKKELEN